MVPVACRFASTTSNLAWVPARHVASDPIVVAAPPRTAPPIVGEVVFLTHRKEQAEAILDGDGRWRCPKMPVLDRVLNALYEPRRFANSDMPFGYGALIAAATWLKGEVRQRREGAARDPGRT
jgi:hypothetical protein